MSIVCFLLVFVYKKFCEIKTLHYFQQHMNEIKTTVKEWIIIKGVPCCH